MAPGLPDFARLRASFDGPIWLKAAEARGLRSIQVTEEENTFMGFKCGILGLSNVGKSTLFNALTATAAAQASNYPFSTIEPNVGEVLVPDPRLEMLAKLANSAKIKPTRLTFVDIAGLVSGASRGEGLGNRAASRTRTSHMCPAPSIRSPTSTPSKPS